MDGERCDLKSATNVSTGKTKTSLRNGDIQMLTSTYASNYPSSFASSIVTDGNHKTTTLLNPIFLSFARNNKLTPRETQVMKVLVTEGLRNDDIAALLHISPKTLKNHLACMMKKTRTSSSRELQAKFFNYAMQALITSG